MVLVGYWPLDEESGDAIDIRNGNNGSLNGGVTQGANGILSQNACSFDGSGYVDTSFSLSQKSTVSMVAWIRWDGSQTDNGRHWILHNRDTANISMALEDGTLDLNVDVTGGGNIERISSETDIRDGEWHLVVTTFNNPEDRGRVNIDGENDKVSSLGNNPDISNMQNYYIGKNRTVNDHYWNGKIQHVRIYNHALTKQEINYLYQVGKRGLHTSSKRTL